MIIIVISLVLWTIIGYFIALRLKSDGVITSDMSLKKSIVIGIICGPITFCAVLFGVIYGIIWAILIKIDN